MDDDIIDLPDFLERVQDDKDLLLELLDIFSEDFLQKRPQLEAAILKKDYEDLNMIAHSLKGASGNVSVKPLRNIFMQLEEMGRKGNVDGAQALLVNIDKEFAKFTVRVASLKKEFQE